MKIIASLIGGSHLYGLNTPESDKDERYIFLNTEIDTIIGLGRHEHQDGIRKEEDKFGFELRRFLNLLRKTNAQVMEILYAPMDAFTHLDSNFKELVLDNKDRLVNTELFYKSLKGYIFGEKRLMLGERTGQLGGKRKKTIDKYGYFYKNAVQLMRLSWCGIEFFTSGVYPVNFQRYDPNKWRILMHIKQNPECYQKEHVSIIVEDLEKELDETFDKRDKSKDRTFDYDFANSAILKLYKPLLESL